MTYSSSLKLTRSQTHKSIISKYYCYMNLVHEEALVRKYFFTVKNTITLPRNPLEGLQYNCKSLSLSISHLIVTSNLFDTCVVDALEFSVAVIVAARLILCCCYRRHSTYSLLLLSSPLDLFFVAVIVATRLILCCCYRCC